MSHDKLHNAVTLEFMRNRSDCPSERDDIYFYNFILIRFYLKIIKAINTFNRNKVIFNVFMKTHNWC